MGKDTSKIARDQSKYEQDEEQDLCFISLSDVLDEFYREMALRGYYLVPQVGARWCGHEVYVRSPYPVDGIQTPEGFNFLKALDVNSDIEINGFRKAVRLVTETANRSTEYKLEKKLWRTIYTDFLDNASDVRSAVAKAAFAVAKDNHRKTTLAGRAGNHKCIPPAEWFPPAVQKLNARDLLTLLPDVEAEAFMLHLGRIAAGASGTDTAEGTITHTYRSYVLLVGVHPGMGKSTLVNYVSDALRVAGYTTSQINSNLSRFGWGTIAASDLASIDDLTDELQRALLADPRIKSVVSNGPMKVEEKGLPAVDVRATTAIIGCTNMTNYSHYLGLDSGSLTRVNQLHTYSPDELRTRWGTDQDYRTLPYWEATAKKLGTSTRVLALWLLRQSMDVFLTVCGYEILDGQLIRSGQDLLEPTVKALRERYVIDVSLKHVEELVKAAAALTATALAKVDDSLYQRYTDLDFSYYLLCTVLRYWIDTKNKPDRPEYGLPSVSPSALNHIKNRLNDLADLSTSKSASAAFTTLASELVTRNGFGYPSKATTYAAHWESLRRDLPAMVERYRSVEVGVNTPLDGVVSAVTKYLKRLA